MQPSRTRKQFSRQGRGFFAVGVESPKREVNVGSLFRTAMIYDAAFVFTIGKRYACQNSDTGKSWKHIPLFHFESIDDLFQHLPHSCPLVGVELDPRAVMLKRFGHPLRACYLLGAEDNGISARSRELCHHLVQLPGDYSMNVAVAGSIVLYDRIAKADSHWQTWTKTA